MSKILLCPILSKLTNDDCLKTETINATKTCPVGYNINGTKCVSIAKNDCDTCNKTCESSYWSEWSNWSTTKVLETSTRQVETREV